MKFLKIAKYQVMDTIYPIRNFYAIFLLVITSLVLLSENSGSTFSSSGIEFASVIFIFVAALNSVRSSFIFSQANNISRKTFFKGIIMGIFPITLAMSIIDLIINRFYNIFVNCPTNFDMIYGSYRDTGMLDINGGFAWTQANDLFTLFGTVIWQFALYSLVFLVGILISSIYYRSNKLIKVIVSVLPVLIIISSFSILSLLPMAFRDAIVQFVPGAFGWYSRNPYIAVFSFTVLGVILAGFAYLLIRKAVVKD